MKALMLILPNFSKMFQVDHNVSTIEIDTNLSLKGHSIEYFDEMLNEAQKKNSTRYLEIYIIVNEL